MSAPISRLEFAFLTPIFCDAPLCISVRERVWWLVSILIVIMFWAMARRISDIPRPLWWALPWSAIAAAPCLRLYVNPHSSILLVFCGMIVLQLPAMLWKHQPSTIKSMGA
jgi:hypothetical protein